MRPWAVPWARTRARCGRDLGELRFYFGRPSATYLTTFGGLCRDLGRLQVFVICVFDYILYNLGRYGFNLGRPWATYLAALDGLCCDFAIAGLFACLFVCVVVVVVRVCLFD